VKDDRVYVEHILECLDRIDQYVADDPEAIVTSTLVLDAVVRRLQTMAESSQRLSDACKTAHPTVSWKELSGLRNVLAHGYLDVDPEQIQVIVNQDLPDLRVQIEEIQQWQERRAATVQKSQDAT
jgi:uncharacterized protein with HEPN domain